MRAYRKNSQRSPEQKTGAIIIVTATVLSIQEWKYKISASTALRI